MSEKRHSVSKAEAEPLAEERLDRIREWVRDRRIVRSGELGRQLGVSAITVRRDLDELERRGEVRRVHGGAVGVQAAWQEPPFDEKADHAVEEKRQIAAAAAQWIGQGETVYLDGGSTVLELARRIRGRTDLTVVTNSLRAAMELSVSGPRLILIGGELRRRSQTLVGPLTRHLLERLHVDKAFMGTIGLTVEDGLTTTEPAEACTKEWVMKGAREVIVLADRAKFGKRSFARAGSLSDVKWIVTSRIAPALRSALKKRGIHILETGGK
jgi:DeoR/GlpR family transcriptional regulator of sugar metabolism